MHLEGKTCGDDASSSLLALWLPKVRYGRCHNNDTRKFGSRSLARPPPLCFRKRCVGRVIADDDFSAFVYVGLIHPLGPIIDGKIQASTIMSCCRPECDPVQVRKNRGPEMFQAVIDHVPVCQVICWSNHGNQRTGSRVYAGRLDSKSCEVCEHAKDREGSGSSLRMVGLMINVSFDMKGVTRGWILRYGSCSAPDQGGISARELGVVVGRCGNQQLRETR